MFDCMPVTGGFLVSLKTCINLYMSCILHAACYVNIHFLSLCDPVFNHFLNIIIWSCYKIFWMYFFTVTSSTRMLPYNFLTVWWISSLIGFMTDKVTRPGRPGGDWSPDSVKKPWLDRMLFETVCMSESIEEKILCEFSPGVFISGILVGVCRTLKILDRFIELILELKVRRRLKYAWRQNWRILHLLTHIIWLRWAYHYNKSDLKNRYYKTI